MKLRVFHNFPTYGILTAAVILLGSGCGDERSSGPATTEPVPDYLSEQAPVDPAVEEDVFRVIESVGKIKFWVGEGYLEETGKPNIRIAQITDLDYWGFNFSIINDVTTGPGNVNFENRGIAVPNLTYDAIGPAQTNSFFDVPVGSYRFVFVRGDQRDVYSVRVTEAAIRLVPQVSTFTYPAHTLYWRRPQNSFALFCSSPGETAFLCDAIVDSLLAYLDLDEFYFPDSGVVGYGVRSGGRYFDTPPRYFRYDAEADFDAAGQILDRFVVAHAGEMLGVSISLTNWQQETHSSWR